MNREYVAVFSFNGKEKRSYPTSRIKALSWLQEQKHRNRIYLDKVEWSMWLETESAMRELKQRPIKKRELISE